MSGVIKDRQYKILKAIQGKTFERGITANELAMHLWFDKPEYKYLFTAVCNGGNNGACSGKKAWLCMGAQVGRLRKKGFVMYARNLRGYVLTKYGEEAIKEYENTYDYGKK